VLLSEIRRGIDQRPVDPDPGRTLTKVHGVKRK